MLAHRRRTPVEVDRHDRPRCARRSAAAAAAGSMLRVAGSMSTSTGRAPVAAIASTVAMNVIADGHDLGCPARRPSPASASFERVGPVRPPRRSAAVPQ